MVTAQFILILVLSACSDLSCQLKVDGDKANIVSNRIEGEWGLDQALTKRLTGKSGLVEKTSKLKFVADSTILSMLPVKVQSNIDKQKIFLAGKLSQEPTKKASLFIITEQHGNMTLMIFRDKGNERWGKVDSVLLTLAVAKDKSDDILFIGGDVNNEPFVAYQRAK